MSGGEYTSRDNPWWIGCYLIISEVTHLQYKHYKLWSNQFAPVLLFSLMLHSVVLCCLNLNKYELPFQLCVQLIYQHPQWSYCSARQKGTKVPLSACQRAFSNKHHIAAITPYLPNVIILSGGLTVERHVSKHLYNKVPDKVAQGPQHKQIKEN